MNTQNLVVLFAESGYQISPEVLEWLCQLPDGSVRGILTRINAKCPDTLVVTFQTLVEAIGVWIVIDYVALNRAIFYTPDFNLYHGVWESVKSGGL